MSFPYDTEVSLRVVIYLLCGTPPVPSIVPANSRDIINNFELYE